MKVYPSEQIRNIGVVSHRSAGKTSLIEAALYASGAIKRLGKVEDGNTTSDYLPEEIKRKMSINTTLAACEWKDCKLNFLDTPGFSDFYGDVVGPMEVCDTLLFVMDSVEPVQVRTEILWEKAMAMKKPTVIFINKMDKEHAQYEKALDDIRLKLSKRTVAVELPIGLENEFHGIIDLFTMKAYEYDNNTRREIPFPEEMRADAVRFREYLMEFAAENDDDLTVKLLDGNDLTEEEMRYGLKIGIREGKAIPVLYGVATENTGTVLLLDFLAEFAPSPLATIDKSLAAAKPAALVFKTMTDPYVGKISMFKMYEGEMLPETTLYNANKETEEKIGQVVTMQGKNQFSLDKIPLGDIGVVAKLGQTVTGDVLTTAGNEVLLPELVFPEPNFSVALVPKTKGDEDKMAGAISRMLEESPTLRYRKDKETRQTILTAMGENHADITIECLQRKFGVNVEKEDIRIPYRETIKGVAKGVEGKHKKQSGGHGQYGHVVVDIEPYADDDFLFTETIFGGSVPKQYIPAIEKGMREAMQEGVLAGFPVTNIKITLTDGSYHNVDSSEMAFKIASNLAFRKGCEQAKPVLLEPIMNLSILVPDQYMGDIMGDMNSRRGRILGMEQEGKKQRITAQAPMAEILRYTPDLKSLSQGKGTYTVSFSHYEEVPANVAEKVIAAHKDKE